MRYIGFGHGTSPGSSARAVAKAFYEGRSLKRTNCWTDGERYYLYENIIARRVSLPHRIARKLLDEYDAIDVKPPIELEITWSGWPTWTTARHLKALGFEASPGRSKNNERSKWWEPPLINGVAVPIHDFTHVFRLSQMPLWHRPEHPTKPIFIDGRLREKFVNATLPLFPT